MNKNKRPGIIEIAGIKLWDFFASLKLTIYLFSFIALASVAGTFLPDRIGMIKFVQDKPLWIFKFFQLFELFDIYYSWWFVLLIIILGVNLLCCSFERLPRVFKIVLKKPLPPSVSKIESLEHKREFLSDGNMDNLTVLAKKFFKSKRMKMYSFKTGETFSCTAEKGRFTRLGVYVAHFGFLLLIAGGVAGTVAGFSGVIDIPEKETGSIVTLFKNRGKIDLGFDVTCSRFEIIRYENSHTPKSYQSEIIFNKGRQAEKKGLVKVNSPLKYNGIKFIQSGYGRVLEGKVKISAYDLMTDEKKGEYLMDQGDKVVLPDGKTEFTLFSFRPNFQISGMNLGETFIGFVLSEGKEIPVALPVSTPGFDKHRKGDFYLVPDDFETRYYTSLQVNKDPGVYIVYSGFLFLSLGIFVSFFMRHSSFYLIFENSGSNSTKVFCAASSNKNKTLNEEIVSDFYNYLLNND
ncbi:MAG: cytochrome c biogenesis protein ResB [Desulfobacteraceae bacterium]|nr:cytochrome c biogenesis protein ResB [Desulfobacteraceae bacterium]